MITVKISAGSPSIVQDIIDMCQSIKSPISEWQGFFYKSTTGSEQWCVWVQRMDEEAHELQYVSSSGLASPPDAYDKITVSCPTVSGFELSFTQVNSMPSVMQTKGGGSAGSRGGGSGSCISIQMSGKASVTDFVTLFNGLATGTEHSTIKVFYNSSSGAKPWLVYAIASTFQLSSIPYSNIIMTMSGVANPSSDSESLAIACPSSSLTSNGFTQISAPLNLSAY